LFLGNKRKRIIECFQIGIVEKERGTPAVIRKDNSFWADKIVSLTTQNIETRATTVFRHPSTVIAFKKAI
jgi:hypothetical protein